MSFVIGSYLQPVFIEIDDEPMENLVEFKPEELKRKMAKDVDGIGVGQRLLKGAIEAVQTCEHNWGMIHFWKNPKMMPPCQVTKIDGVWYKRKDCSMIDLDNLES